MNHCTTCRQPTLSGENEYGEFICDSCEQNRAEQSWERYCEAYYGGDFPLPLSFQQFQAQKLK
jgi:hypothetical protein